MSGKLFFFLDFFSIYECECVNKVLSIPMYQSLIVLLVVYFILYNYSDSFSTTLNFCLDMCVTENIRTCGPYKNICLFQHYILHSHLSSNKASVWLLFWMRTNKAKTRRTRKHHMLILNIF